MNKIRKEEEDEEEEKKEEQGTGPDFFRLLFVGHG